MGHVSLMHHSARQATFIFFNVNNLTASSAEILFSNKVTVKSDVRHALDVAVLKTWHFRAFT